MTEIHKLTKTEGSETITILPATTTDAVIHPGLQSSLTNLINEYNISVLFPTSGIDGTNKYNLELATSILNQKLNSEQKIFGIKIAFINNNGEWETWRYIKSPIVDANTKDNLNWENITQYFPSGNRYIKEIYLTGDGIDSSHTYVLSRFARNHATYGYAIYIKDLTTNIEYYVGFSSVEPDQPFINKRTSNTGGDTTKNYKTYMYAIVNWEEMETGKYITNINLPLIGVLSLERNPYINSFLNKQDTNEQINDLEIEFNNAFGDNSTSEQLTGQINLTSTFYLNFNDIVQSSNINNPNFKIEVTEGKEHIKPNTVGVLVNDSYYIIQNNNLTYDETGYIAYISVIEEDFPITTFSVAVGVPNQISQGNITIVVTNENSNSISYKIDKLEKTTETLEQRVEDLENNDNGSDKPSNLYTPTIEIGNNIYCVVNDKIQLYYDMFIHHIGDYSLNIKCQKGKNYTRYWEYLPTTSDVGTTTMTIQLLNIDGEVIEEKQTNIITINPQNPTSSKNILFVGDSLMMDGQIPIEVSRRLKGTTGVATSPQSLNLTNYNIVGRRKNSDQTVGWEGTGGWSFGTYLSSTGMEGVRFTVSGATDIRPGDIYTIDGFEQRFQIGEINLTEGSGYVFGGFYGKYDIYNNQELLPTTGTLEIITGNGQDNISFTNASVERYQPFWNTETNQFDITSYINKYCNGKLDIICIYLGPNNYIGSNPYTYNYNYVLDDAKQLFSKIHEQSPNTLIIISYNILPSQNGGLGYNYAASGDSGSFLTTSWNYKVHKMNRLYKTIETDKNYKDYVKVIDLCSQVDSNNCYPYIEKEVNNRSTEKEKVGTNGVHPSNTGYWLMADGWFRSIINLTK